GGGCHLAVGINVKKMGNYYVHTHRGSLDDKEISVSQTEGAFPTCADKTKVFIGLAKDKLQNPSFLAEEIIEKRPLDFSEMMTTDDLYFTSSHCYEVMNKIKYNS